MNLVTMRDVSVAYDGYEAIQHVDLEIGDDDFLGVIGPNLSLIHISEPTRP